MFNNLVDMRSLSLTILLFIFGQFSHAQSSNDIYNVAYQQLRDGVNAPIVLETLQICIEQDEKFEDAYMLRAFIFYKLDDFTAAINDYNSLLEINPTHSEALKKRAITKVRIKDYEGAIEDHNTRIKIDPYNAVAYFDRAYCKGQLKDMDGAIEDYTKAITLDENYASAFANRGMAMIVKYGGEDKEQLNLEQRTIICENLQQARQLGFTSIDPYLLKYCHH